MGMSGLFTATAWAAGALVCAGCTLDPMLSDRFDDAAAPSDADAGGEASVPAERVTDVLELHRHRNLAAQHG